MGTRRNNSVITMSKRRRFDVIMTLILRQNHRISDSIGAYQILYNYVF